MDRESEYTGLLRYELIGGLCYLALFLSGALTWVLRRAVGLFFAGAEPYAAVLLLNLSYDLISLLFLILLLRRWLAGQARQLRANGPRKTLHHLLAGGGLLLAALLILSRIFAFVAVFFPELEYSNGNQSNLEALYNRFPLWSGLLICITSPVLEELLFRGVLFAGLYDRSRVLAYFLSALAFALPHVSAYLSSVPLPVTALNLLFYGSMGGVLAWSWAKSRTIFVPILLHAAYNTVMTLITSV